MIRQDNNHLPPTADDRSSIIRQDAEDSQGTITGHVTQLLRLIEWLACVKSAARMLLQHTTINVELPRARFRTGITYETQVFEQSGVFRLIILFPVHFIHSFSKDNGCIYSTLDTGKIVVLCQIDPNSSTSSEGEYHSKKRHELCSGLLHSRELDRTFDPIANRTCRASLSSLSQCKSNNFMRNQL
jgi:hypothetical protein